MSDSVEVTSDGRGGGTISPEVGSICLILVADGRSLDTIVEDLSKVGSIPSGTDGIGGPKVERVGVSNDKRLGGSQLGV